MNASLPFGPPINTDIDYYQAYFIIIIFFVSYAMLVMHGLLSGACIYITGVRFTKVFRTELGHKYILVECSVIALCLPVVSKLSRYKLVCYK